MSKFTDRKEREWYIELTIGANRRIKAQCDVDLLSALEGDLIARLATDAELLVDVLWAILEPQAKEKGVDPLEFADSFMGETIDSATAAFMEAIPSFFARQGRREILTKILQKTEQAMTVAETLGIQKADQIDVEKVVRQAEQELQTQLDSSG